MTFKSAMSNIGNGLLTGATVLSNSGIQTQIDEVDIEIKMLEEKLTIAREKKTELKNRLIAYR